MIGQFTESTRAVGAIAPARRCLRCRGTAACVRAYSDSYREIPGGTEYRFQCQCGHHFTIEGYGRVVLTVIAAPLLAAVAVSLFIDAPSHADKSYTYLLGGTVFMAAALGMLVQQALKLRLRFRTRIQ